MQLTGALGPAQSGGRIMSIHWGGSSDADGAGIAGIYSGGSFYADGAAMDLLNPVRLLDGWHPQRDSRKWRKVPRRLGGFTLRDIALWQRMLVEQQEWGMWLHKLRDRCLKVL